MIYKEQKSERNSIFQSRLNPKFTISQSFVFIRDDFRNVSETLRWWDVKN